jgi:hypothetical protein
VSFRDCTVNCRDLQGVDHSISVTAETLYEAVAKALAIFRTEQWVGEIGKGLTSLRVTVKHPAIDHHVKVQGFEHWLERGGSSPAEVAMKIRLRGLLKG